jgi:DNA-binding IclR family transcriptional regulator
MIPLDTAEDDKERNGVQSVEVGLSLFKQLVLAGKPLGLSDLARQADMHRSKAHRYLVSLIQAGFVRQDQDSGQYDIGPFVLDLSIAYMARQNPIQLAAPAAAQLADECNQTCLLAVWGNSGATVIRLFKPPRQVAISIDEGTVFNLTMSATGRLFAAYLPQQETKAQLQREVAQHRAAGTHNAPQTQQQLDAMLDEVRSQGLSQVRGHNAPGIDAIAAPVFDSRGRIVLGLTLVGPEMSLDVGYDGKPAQMLRNAARQVSIQLGHTAAQ